MRRDRHGLHQLVAFYLALLCLGVGWNFMFVGGTTLLALSHLPSERARVQGVAELIRYGFTAVATLAAGPVLERFGWAELNVVIFPMLAVAAIMTVVWMRASHTNVAQETASAREPRRPVYGLRRFFSGFSARYALSVSAVCAPDCGAATASLTAGLLKSSSRHRNCSPR